MCLLKLVEYRRLRIGSHARGARFVQRPSRRGRIRVRADILGARHFQHFAGRVSHVFDHRLFVFAVFHINLQHRNSVDVFHVGIDLHTIFPAWQNLAKSRQVKIHSRFAQRLLVRFAKSGGLPIEIDARSAFVSKASQKVLGGRLSFQIAKPRNVNSNGLRGPP